jgi:hypothetical protein
MEDRSGKIHLTTDEARGGTTSHGVRWVLAFSLLAAIVLLSIMWMTSASMHSDAEDKTSDSATTTAGEQPGKSAATPGAPTRQN